MNFFLSIIPLVLINLTVVVGSDGDMSPFYQICLRHCLKLNCTQDGEFTVKARQNQDMWSSVMLWSCRDECVYHCMWKTVHKFKQSGTHTPKFYGKWPFVKFMGMQEPAAAFSSILNLLANAYMYSKIRREFSIRTTPLVLFWHVFAIICMNAWVWSTIFHTRDKPFTEFMDYACALSMVMALFVAAVVRVFHRRRKLTALLLTVPVFYFITHVQYLYAGRINYDYNMKVNVFFGVCGSVLWVCWSVQQYWGGRVYAWRVGAFTVAAGAALTLELADFPPLAAVWDAHALWHLTTAPLPLLFYRFVIDDLRYLQLGQYQKFDTKIT